MAEWIKMTLGMAVDLGPCRIALDGTELHLPKNGAEPPHPVFGPFLLWPMAGCITMPLGMKVGLCQATLC